MPQGDVFVQGIPLALMKNWFKRNSAYVRQLTCPYYEELTVRENILLSANMQMPPDTKVVQVLERVEQVINEVGVPHSVTVYCKHVRIVIMGYCYT